MVIENVTREISTGMDRANVNEEDGLLMLVEIGIGLDHTLNIRHHDFYYPLRHRLQGAEVTVRVFLACSIHKMETSLKSILPSRSSC